MVKTNFSDNAVFPWRIRVPLSVANAASVGRRVTIQTSDQELPEPLVEWLQDKYPACFVAVETDDLTVLPGIGAAAQDKLNAIGVNTYADVARCEVSDLASFRAMGEERAADCIAKAKELSDEL